jgi:sigma-E factor negative regulatory protein RseA
MSEKTREHISCLMDGEVSRETSRFLVRRLGSDEELCATWTRYHLVRDCLRHGDGAFSEEDLCNRVNRALADEAPARSARRFPVSWLKPAAGAAIAASVALVAVFAVSPGGQAPQSAPAVASQAESFTSPQSLGSGPAARQASLAGGAPSNQKMNAYLLRHYQAAGHGNGRGFVSLASFAVQNADAQAAPADTGETDKPDDTANK